jgi:hypothetical protein
LAADRDHVIAHTHDANCSACFRTIHVIDQQDYCPCTLGESFGFTYRPSPEQQAKTCQQARA